MDGGELGPEGEPVIRAVFDPDGFDHEPGEMEVINEL